MEYEFDKKIKQFILSHEKFLVAGHKNPDGDCAGSQIAMVHFLKRIGKKAHAISQGGFERREIQHLENQFLQEPEKLSDILDYVNIILDTSTIGRVGNIWPLIKPLKSLVIDHHSSREDFGDLLFVKPGAPSTSYLVLLLIEQLGYKPDPTEAGLLLLGLCTDTGYFRHLVQGAPVIFQAVSRLTAAGASVKQIFRQMFGGINLAERKLLGRILCKTEEHFSQKLLLTSLDLEEKESIHPMTMKTEEVYRLLQMVEDNEILVFIKQENVDKFSVSFRSKGTVTVDDIAAALGGGGHQLAAGCEMQGTYQQVRGKILETVVTFLG